MRSVSIRLLSLERHYSSSATIRQQYQGMASKMVAQKFDINSTYKMNSGYEIPVLGYGVRLPNFYFPPHYCYASFILPLLACSPRAPSSMTHADMFSLCIPGDRWRS